MTKRNHKKLDIFITQLDNLLDEKINISFKERPFLENPTNKPQILNLKERRRENELKIKKIIEKINELVVTKVSV